MPRKSSSSTADKYQDALTYKTCCLHDIYRHDIKCAALFFHPGPVILKVTDAKHIG